MIDRCKLSLRYALLSTSVFVMNTCGGGGSSSDSGTTTTTANASPGGIWRGTESVTGLEILGLITESGKFHFIRADGVQYVGTASTSGSSISANFEGFTPFGMSWSDGSTHGTGSTSGTIQARSSITGTTQFRTDAGTATNGTGNLTFDALYDRASSLETLSGNFMDSTTGVVVTVNSNGSAFAQNPATGCVMNRSVSIINASYNAYRVEFSYASCHGQAAALNGVQFSGIATLDNTVSPERGVVGVTGQSGGTRYAVVSTLTRS